MDPAYIILAILFILIGLLIFAYYQKYQNSKDRTVTKNITDQELRTFRIDLNRLKKEGFFVFVIYIIGMIYIYYKGDMHFDIGAAIFSFIVLILIALFHISFSNARVIKIGKDKIWVYSVVKNIESSLSWDRVDRAEFIGQTDKIYLFIKDTWDNLAIAMLHYDKADREEIINLIKSRLAVRNIKLKNKYFDN